MKLCHKCRSRAPVLLCFVNGKPVLTCMRHRHELTPDPVVGWLRIPKVTREVEDAPQ
jgi:hypothetical protein